MNNELILYYVNEDKSDLEYCLQYFITDFNKIVNIIYNIDNNSLIKIYNNDLFILSVDNDEIDNIPLVNIQILKYYIGIFKRINENTIIIDINNNDDYKLFVNEFYDFYRISDYISAYKKEFFYIVIIDNEAYLTRKPETDVILDNINSIDIFSFIRLNKLKKYYELSNKIR